MRPTHIRHIRRLVLLMCLCSGAALALFACADDGGNDGTVTPNGGGADASRDATGTSSNNDGDVTADPDGKAPNDGGQLGDAKKDAASAKDANGPLEAGAECAFNRECQAALRCECSEATGCACKVGARGTGQNGIDACDSGEQCASSLCVESAAAGQSLCSDECVDGTDCQPNLPRCLPIFGFPSPICVRPAQ